MAVFNYPSQQLGRITHSCSFVFKYVGGKANVGDVLLALLVRILVHQLFVKVKSVWLNFPVGRERST